jgi:hypothetical protein
VGNWYVRDFIDEKQLQNELQVAENAGFEVHHVTQNGAFYTIVARRPRVEIKVADAEKKAKKK